MQVAVSRIGTPRGAHQRSTPNNNSRTVMQVAVSRIGTPRGAHLRSTPNNSRHFLDRGHVPMQKSDQRVLEGYVPNPPCPVSSPPWPSSGGCGKRKSK
jgi:hypothetical protein